MKSHYVVYWNKDKPFSMFVSDSELKKIQNNESLQIHSILYDNKGKVKK